MLSNPVKKKKIRIESLSGKMNLNFTHHHYNQSMCDTKCTTRNLLIVWRAESSEQLLLYLV